ncbi:hypothetical protein [Mucilaginibacter sp.]|uniref:NHL domain-containing protein n=1 Tax=Mucilaginibacter sp. TaxID=1882438 RepID=UPI0026290823|nr:hypothetical protein [Mucilaginibacter sp.]MDB5129835.1 hypothetical protein [Mucilaginibacter sp.]
MKATCLVLKLGVLLLLFITPACKKAEIAKPVQNSKADIETLVNPDQILVHAGSTPGFADGPALQAQFSRPTFLSAGPDKSLYVYDSELPSLSIRKISCSGMVITFYRFTERERIAGMTVDKNGCVYISQGYQIKKISADGKTIKVVAGSGEIPGPRKDGPALQATFAEPAGLAINKDGCLFILDSRYNIIRKLSNNIITVVAGGIEFPRPISDKLPRDGVGTDAEFDNPRYLSIDNDDNLYVTGGYYALIKKVTPKGVVTTIAVIDYGFDTDYLSVITQTTVDQSGNLYGCWNWAVGFKEQYAFTIFKWTTNGVYQETLASNSYQKQDQDDPFVPADGLIFPTGFVAVNDTLYFSNTREHKIRKIALK